MKKIAYPIKPRHLSTKEEPKGFDIMCDYGERMILWALVEYCQWRGNWESFTWDDFMKFFDNKDIKIKSPVRSGILYFSGPGVDYLFTRVLVGDDKVLTLTPTHFMISHYFLWNPVKNLLF